MILEKILSRLRPRSRSGGWLRFNCPVCIYNGEERPDKRMSGSMYVDVESETIFYHCFRCNYKTAFRAGDPLSGKFSFLLKNFGFNDKEIEEITLESTKIEKKEKSEIRKPENHNIKRRYKFPEKTLNILEALEKFPDDKNFLDVLKYIKKRGGEKILHDKYHIFHWNPREHLNRYIFLAFEMNGKQVGYVARNIDNKNFLMKRPRGIFFNQDVVFDKCQKYIIVCEGPFDALSTNGLAVCGNRFMKEHVEFLQYVEKTLGKTIIVMPDRNSPYNCDFLETAKKNNWYVSVPSFDPNDDFYWDNDIKDANEALIRYGKFYTCLSIVKNRTKDYTKVAMILKLNYNKKAEKADGREIKDLYEELKTKLYGIQ